VNSIILSLAYLKHRLLATALNVVTFASGIALIVALLLINAQLQIEFSRNLKGIDLVVSAKGSPLQMILSSVFHLDTPTGKIPLSEAETLASHPMVKEAIPVALGDNYEGFRIVGTRASYIGHYGGELAKGKTFEQPMEAVLGSEVAAATSLSLDERFFATHGLEAGGDLHSTTSYTVVGILKPTGGVLDRLVLTPLESVWHVHDNDESAQGHVSQHAHIENYPRPLDEEEAEEEMPRGITALLVAYRSPMAAPTLKREIAASQRMMGASPSAEVVRLHSFMGAGVGTLKAFGWFLIALAGFGIFVALYNAMNERRHDLALLRSFGASPGKLLLLMFNESLVVAFCASLFGILLGHVCVEMAGQWLEETRHISITGYIFVREELWLMALSLIIAVLAAILPAVWIARIDIYKTLVREY
jgi:putative ABC transport system permease protein